MGQSASLPKRRIGSLETTVVGLGCNNFGGRLDAEATERVVLATIDAGVNFFDTADVYGGTKSEEFLGRALGKRRSEVIVATKFGHAIDDQRKGAKPAYIRQAAEDSLRRLGTDYIDLYQLHRPDTETPIEDILDTLNELVQSGKVREIGASNFSAEQVHAAAKAVKPGAASFVSLQNHYSMLHREPEDRVLAEVEDHGLAFLPFFPLANGLLTGKYRKGQPLPEGTRIQPEGRFAELLSDQNLTIVESLIAFSEKRGHTILELAFSWLLTRPTVASVIAGATSAEQIQKNAAAATWQLTEADLAEIDTILASQTK